MEQLLARQAVNAAWRLERCDEVESRLVAEAAERGIDPLEDDALRARQLGVDELRATAQEALRQCLQGIRAVRSVEPSRVPRQIQEQTKIRVLSEVRSILERNGLAERPAQATAKKEPAQVISIETGRRKQSAAPGSEAPWHGPAAA